jgi:hypothetical protein
MTEEEPFKDAEDIGPTKVPLKGPNVSSTFDTPPHPDAVKAQDAAIRKHLQARRPQPGQADGA